MVDFYINLFSSIELIKSYQSSIFIISVLLAGIPIFGFMAVNALVAVYVERKVSAFMQDRLGPMGHGVGLHAGKWGVLQTLADAKINIAMITTSEIRTSCVVSKADGLEALKVVHKFFNLGQEKI